MRLYTGKMNFLLKTKHWQLFILTYGLPFLFRYAIAFTPDIDAGVEYFTTLLPLFFTGLAMLIYLMWLWTAAINLQSLIPMKLLPNPNVFKGSFIALLGIVTCYVVIFMYVFGPNALAVEFVSFAIFSTFGLILLPLAVVLIPWFICTRFLARSLALVKLKRKVASSDYLADLFLILLFPIGIWIIQPRLNALFDRKV